MGGLRPLCYLLSYNVHEMGIIYPHVTELKCFSRLRASGEIQRDGRVIREALWLIKKMGVIKCIIPYGVMQGSVNPRPYDFICPSEESTNVAEFL